MCGIVGYIGATLQPEVVLRKMMHQIAHRGPDGEGMWINGPAALGHRRLSIIDPAGGAQPIFNENHTIAVICNGEIYNYPQLRAQLIEKGHRFSTNSDTEVLVHGYEEWGKAMPEKLRGMFAFAIWDSLTQTMFCARDVFGIKPFYYYQKNNGPLLFASEIKAFLPHPAFEKELNTEQLPAYMCFQYSPGENTFFQNVKKLLPAHWLCWQAGEVTIGRYWQFEHSPQGNGTIEEWGDRIHAAMQESVQAHKLADVPIGCFLSSGVDSSYLAALSGAKQTFTIGFSDKRYSEIDKAQWTAEQLGVQLHSCQISAWDYWHNLGEIQYAMDEPLADASAPALYFLAKEAASKVKVCLSGEGADELFGGYNIYTEPFHLQGYDCIPLVLRRAVGAVAEYLPPVRGVNFLVRRSRPLEQRYLGGSCLMTDKQARRLLQPDVVGPAAVQLSQPHFSRTSTMGPVPRMQTCDLNLWLVGDILLKADKMSMAHSLEVRVPYLDKNVFAVAAEVPEYLRANTKETKIALRHAAARLLPPEVTKRRKLGFPAPVRTWLKEPQYLTAIEQAFRSPEAARFFRPGALAHLLRLHAEGKADVWRQIWCVYTFLVWYREYFIKR